MLKGTLCPDCKGLGLRTLNYEESYHQSTAPLCHTCNGTGLLFSELPKAKLASPNEYLPFSQEQHGRYPNQIVVDS